MSKSDKNKKFWLVKYCLTDPEIKQVTCVKVELSSDYVYPVGQCYYASYKNNKDVFEDFADALIKAEDMRCNKIASLKKQIKKLEAIKFSLVSDDAE